MMKKSCIVITTAAILLSMALSVQAKSNVYRMAHWANVRDSYGNLIGQVQEGDRVELGCQDFDEPSRVWITAGTLHGTVSAVYVFGGTVEQYNDPYGYVDFEQYGRARYDDFMKSDVSAWPEEAQVIAMEMIANVRNDDGYVIGMVDAGEEVELFGDDQSNPSRTWIRTSNGTFGTVPAEAVYAWSFYSGR